MKKWICMFVSVMMLAVCLTGCGSKGENASNAGSTAKADSSKEETKAPEDTAAADSSFDKSKTINVISREEGSGTRGAFVELFGVEEKDADGNKVDHTYSEAIVVSKTDVVLTNVASDSFAIGYVSLGSLNDTVKAVQIGGVDATVDNIKNGSYEISRPFNIATKGDVSDAAQDFINYIMSSEGQQVIEDNKYIKIDDQAEAFKSTGAKGKVVVAGSSSVTPVMEKLKEAYASVNPDVQIEVQQSDSTTGMQSAMEGACDIGMASRELKDTELKTLKSTSIALDGIAVIVSKDNPITNMTKDQVKDVFTGAVTTWDSIK